MCRDDAQAYHYSDPKSLAPSPEFSLLQEAFHNHSSSPDCPYGTRLLAPEHGHLSNLVFLSCLPIVLRET